MARIKLTKTSVETAPSPGASRRTAPPLVPGFLCKITPTGYKVSVLPSRTAADDRHTHLIVRGRDDTGKGLIIAGDGIDRHSVALASERYAIRGRLGVLAGAVKAGD